MREPGYAILSVGLDRIGERDVDDDKLPALIARYKADPESVYNTWFIDSPARLKAFRSIRCGVGAVVAAIRGHVLQ